jgi:DNA-binding SARP family transcriptional activator
MRLSLLGPLVLADSAGDRVAVSGPRLRVLLAALLLHANIPVPTSELAELVWDGCPSPGAVATLRSYVRRLRAAVDPQAARITASGAGYVIRALQFASGRATQVPRRWHAGAPPACQHGRCRMA